MKPGFKTFLIKSKFNYSQAKLYSEAYDKILDSDLFDEDFYYKMYPGLKVSGMDSLTHYLFYGYLEGKVPSLKFEGNRYLHRYTDVSINPLVHYVMFGKEEGYVAFNSPILTHYERILETNKLFLNNYTFDKEPLVSIIILNLNGLVHLKRLFKDFKDKTNYNNFEIIVVDNGSDDGSLEYLESLRDVLPLQIIVNKVNKSFSEANNQAVKESNGELILLLNNDMEPTYGWLNELVGTFKFNSNVGAVGAKLIYPFYFSDEENFKSYLIQHAGDIFDERIKPCCAYAYNRNKFEQAFDVSVNCTRDAIAVTAAAVLTSHEIYDNLGGLDEDYFYGFEDVDFMLKLNQAGYRVLYCASALLFHHESSTRIQDKEEYFKNNLKNTKVLWENQGEYITKEIYKDKLDNIGFFTEKPFKFTLLVDDFSIDSSDYSLVSSVAQILNARACNVELLTLSDEQKASDDSDIILSFSKDYPISDLVYRKNAIKVYCGEIDDSAYDFTINKNMDAESLVSELFNKVSQKIKN